MANRYFGTQKQRELKAPKDTVSNPKAGPSNYAAYSSGESTAAWTKPPGSPGPKRNSAGSMFREVKARAKQYMADDAALGSGGRFKALKAKLSTNSKIDDPGALAASIGRKKYGKAKFQSLAAKGKE